MTTNIVAISGSLRRESFNRKLVEAAMHELPADVELEIWDGLAEVPPFSEDLEDGPAPAAVAGFRRAIAAADGVLIATPEYNGSIPGQLKNALDWASRPYRDSALTGKPVAVIGASPSPGGAASAQADLRRVLARSGAEVADGQLEVAHAPRQFDEFGRLLNEPLRSRLGAVIESLYDHIHAGRVLAEAA
jgi:chromate reductase, NAD(P)H dehydrogenase (quinone)